MTGTTWVATLTFERGATAEQMIAWDEQLAEHDGSVGQHAHGMDVTVYVDAPDPVTAVIDARAIIINVVALNPIGAEVVTELEYERRADAPTIPAMMSAPEVADILGVTRQRVHQLRAHAGFPPPLLELRTGPIWEAALIEKFAAEWDRKPGRPAKVEGDTVKVTESAVVHKRVTPMPTGRTVTRKAADGRYVVGKKKSATSSNSRRGA